MNREQQKSQQLPKVNHYLREWDDNEALDVKKKYTFTATHQQEGSHLILGEAKPGERYLLGYQQVPESYQRQARNSQERIIMEARTIQRRLFSTCNGSKPVIDQQQTQEPLSLDRQHKIEWETLVAVEAESWRALGKLQHQVIMQLRSAGASWSQQIRALKEQQVDIQSLHRANQQKRALLLQHQAMDNKGQFIWSH